MKVEIPKKRLIRFAKMEEPFGIPAKESQREVAGGAWKMVPRREEVVCKGCCAGDTSAHTCLLSALNLKKTTVMLGWWKEN